ncbi:MULTISPECIES: 30S ribosome-binding factor RbfA [unclassified Mycoplasma]|uniref:30S ribosome-binding factor RbfA n=1 Tax=unclassified Mycoplasma TaxID=2683645 RepID=UPI00211B9CDF|nr:MULTISPECIES: 30S ribosome-binding factor RbfA [unclassified Mycoplasma]UUM20088.1 30S ribosome-binding factor RbfA [Mycoplasma sp. 1578d]UUM25068.1 30S ribosome-binding factor RbfA [Mycoplasma sp. 3686d]
MNNVNLSRKESQIMQLVADILSRDINNVNVIDPVVVDAKLSADLSHLKVFVSLAKNTKKGIQALNNASGFVRSVLAKSLSWRKVPVITFELDQVTNHGMKIDAILNQLKQEK